MGYIKYNMSAYIMTFWKCFLNECMPIFLCKLLTSEKFNRCFCLVVRTLVATIGVTSNPGFFKMHCIFLLPANVLYERYFEVRKTCQWLCENVRLRQHVKDTPFNFIRSQLDILEKKMALASNWDHSFFHHGFSQLNFVRGFARFILRNFVKVLR